jgi:regulatory protein
MRPSMWCRLTTDGPTPGSLADASADADPEQVARSIALRRLESAPRTRHELAVTLARKGVPDDVSARVLDRFTEVGLIDDEAFAHAWVSSRHISRGLGRRVLQQELRRKGVDPEVIESACAQIDTEDEKQRAYEWATARASRMLRSDSSTPLTTLQRRLAGQLARKGYHPGLCYEIARSVLSNDSVLSSDSVFGDDSVLGSSPVRTAHGRDE